MITFKLKNKSFRILRDGTPIFSLTEGARIAEVANIDADYTMSRGSFVLPFLHRLRFYIVELFKHFRYNRINQS